VTDARPTTKPGSSRGPQGTNKLRTGFTTGTCASAAAKAAAIGLVTGCPVDSVDVALPSGHRVHFGVEADPSRPARAVVVKDAGDDPDCTHGARITADAAASPASHHRLGAGIGVGTVTRPGLGLAIGSPAINPVPRRMILAALAEVTTTALDLTFSVPGGDVMAERTTNARLGIVGGISILGTTGIVRPFSTAAYRASVTQQVDVAAAQGQRELALATGSRSEAAARRLYSHLDDVCFVEVGDFTGITLRRAAAGAITRVALVAMVGKIAKLAAGVMMTHFHRSEVDTDLLAEVAADTGAPAAVVASATDTATARHFYETCRALGHTRALDRLCSLARARCQDHTNGAVAVEVLMVDFEGLEVVARD